MNNQLRSEIRAMLEARKHDLNDVITEESGVLNSQLNVADSGEGQVDFNHPADMLQGDPDYEKELHIIERQRAELVLVNRALSRLDTDEFGFCEDCGAEISYARIKAIPYARFCIVCQERFEANTSKLTRDSAPQVVQDTERKSLEGANEHFDRFTPSA